MAEITSAEISSWKELVDSIKASNLSVEQHTKNAIKSGKYEKAVRVAEYIITKDIEVDPNNMDDKEGNFIGLRIGPNAPAEGELDPNWDPTLYTVKIIIRAANEKKVVFRLPDTSPDNMPWRTVETMSFFCICNFISISSNR